MNLRTLVPFRGGQSQARSDLNVFGSLQREVDRLFDDFARGFGTLATPGNGNLTPSMDIGETDKEFVITAELPGLERKDIEISLEDNVLTIRGEKKIETTPGDKGNDGNKGQDKNKNQNQNQNVHVSERAYGVFYRVVELPFNVDPSSVQATMSKGVLKITIPKPARPQTKKIEVKEAA
jgi:HSP20 family protein